MSLCPSSIFGAIRTGSYMTYILMTKGLKQSVCDQSFYNGPVSKFWAYAFVLSKAPELGKSRLFCVQLFYPRPQCARCQTGCRVFSVAAALTAVCC